MGYLEFYADEPPPVAEPSADVPAAVAEEPPPAEQQVAGNPETCERRIIECTLSIPLALREEVESQIKGRRCYLNSHVNVQLGREGARALRQLRLGLDASGVRRRPTPKNPMGKPISSNADAVHWLLEHIYFSNVTPSEGGPHAPQEETGVPAEAPQADDSQTGAGDGD